ncbi:protein OSB3, chloroplastic/mitochondrial-like isoform X2 [Chenopodium quinoa]|uniref:protein OSB3, chloroplastic/mitochondrial-like isoform X2 n=1 Tax=Chenopodium quinoa TaxID=63459 RepID=UPI000B77947F|nr:protein OSB3, chloroplastic/mitochondrial-like isoform X2 [Chenopodium quinoa]
MISRAFLRLHSPATISLIRTLNGATHLSSSAAGLAAAQAHSYSAAASVDCADADARNAARLSTVTWSPQLHNSVSFIGTVDFPVKKFASQDDRFGVYTSLRVKTSPNSDSSFWITLVMWDELAERALLHLKQNDYIYISGELGSYTKAISEGKESLRYKVTAKELNYVKLDELGKLSQRAADPEKETGESSLQKKNNRLHLWQLLFANPNEWYDNRKSKKNPKQPDFKHKSTGEVLWFSERDPPWVKKQVDILNSRLSGGPNYGVSSKYSPSRSLSDELFMVPNPTMTEEELDDAEPVESGKNFQKGVNSDKETGDFIGEGKSSSQKKNDRLHLWKKFFANPDEWYDNRKSKMNPKQPDFKHKSSGEALWFSERDPLWVKEQVEILGSRHVGGANSEAISKSSSAKLVSGEPLEELNLNVTAKEFTLDEPGKNFQRVEISGSETREGKSSLQKKSDRLHLWKKLFANPDEWYDNRKSKKNPKQPDFKHKSSGEALWFSERDPLWVKEQVELLGSGLLGAANNEATSKSCPTKWVSGELLEELNPNVTAEELTLDEPGETFQSVENSGSETRESKSSAQKKLRKKFFAYPDEWYDNRKSKKNPKQPDFKHKTSGEALWLSGCDSPWVKKQIKILDSGISREPING